MCFTQHTVLILRNTVRHVLCQWSALIKLNLHHQISAPNACFWFYPILKLTLVIFMQLKRVLPWCTGITKLLVASKWLTFNFYSTPSSYHKQYVLPSLSICNYPIWCRPSLFWGREPCCPASRTIKHIHCLSTTLGVLLTMPASFHHELFHSCSRKAQVGAYILHS